MGSFGTRQLITLFAIATSLVACGGDDDDGGAQAAEDGVKCSTSAKVGACGSVETHCYEGATASHVSECSEVEYATSPPVFGSHYPVWAAYQTYDFPVPLGYLVHDLEHGAVVFSYNCPEGCADTVAKIQDFIAGLPEDARCVPEVQRQVILTPDPTLERPFAAAAWGYSLAANCFDASTFLKFYEAHVGKGPEDLCADGMAFESDPCR